MKFMVDNFTIIENLLLFLESFAVLCSLQSSVICATKCMIPLINNYDAVISDVLKYRFSRNPACPRTYTLLEKFTKKMSKYFNNYYSAEICCSSTFLTLGLSNNKFWIEKYSSSSQINVPKIIMYAK